MKWVVLTALVCNQLYYDSLYKGIILDTMKYKLDHKTMERRNDAIEFLRKLCRGQRSSYEKG